MRHRIITLLGAFGLIGFLTLSGCEKPTDPEVIATVNGRPITLSELLSAHDPLSIPGAQGQNADALREAYGDVLGHLIIAELVEQDLDKKKQAVTDAEVNTAEADIRADFPPKEFENMLLEEAIDYDIWRKSLRRRLNLERFMQQVLVPVLDPKDIERFYLEHQQDFHVDGRIVFLQLSGISREQVAEGCAFYAQDKDVAALQQRFPGLEVRELRISETRLPPETAKAMRSLKPYEYTRPQETNFEFTANILLRREEPRQYSLAEAYSFIQDQLREENSRENFDAWLAKRLRKADIQVVRPLLPENLR